jgi:hypothetical protein
VAAVCNRNARSTIFERLDRKSCSSLAVDFFRAMITVLKRKATERVVVAELLDQLAADDPRALKSRRDLRMINFLMGNETWILRQLHRHRKVSELGIVELGAGDGSFSRRIHRRLPMADLAAYDLLPEPIGVEEGIFWHQGDVTLEKPMQDFGVLVANLFLHHFRDEDLSWLRAWMARAQVMIFNEPLRSKLAHRLGNLLHPWINDVTRHDMHVSIDAGFHRGEIPALYADCAKDWAIVEQAHWKGALRSVWVRK